ncbi:MAG: vanadium-dependent haloperoxidase [bacterium]
MIIPPRVATVVLAATVLLSACNTNRKNDPKVVAEWMRTLYGTIRVERLSPPVASRLSAYATAALYSGLATSSDAMAPLTGALNGFPDLPKGEVGTVYDGTLAAVAAERVVLDTMLREALPTTLSSVRRLADSLEAARSADGVSEDTRKRSSELGRRIGLSIVSWSRTDGFDSTRGRKYVAPVGPGLWVNDAPGNTFASQNLSGATQSLDFDNPANLQRPGNMSDRGLILSRPKRAGLATLPPVNMAGTSEPYWGQVRPFVLKSWGECEVPRPPQYSMDSESERHRDADNVATTGKTLTPEQKAIALYWADNAGESGTPVGHWISIASQMVSERHLSAEDAARMMVLTAVAHADAFIASWGYKYQFNIVRPRPYIRAFIDSTWEPFIPTPPFPEYPSGHSTVSSSAATVLAALLGDTPFTDSTSISIGHAPRTFRSFTAASEEAGQSRIYGGIHFPSGNLGGRALGKCIGLEVVARLKAERLK